MRGYAILGLLALSATLAAQSLYKYRDADGNWVYTDRRPDDAREVEQVQLAESAAPPEVTVTRRVVDGQLELVVNNGCFCPTEVAVQLFEPRNVTVPPEPILRTIAPARRETVLLKLAALDADKPMSVGYQYLAVLGDPKSEHAVTEPYRAPFALARAFRVTQAAPVQITHRDASSTQAVDIEMPIGTQVYAARSGTVIEVASRFFEGGVDRVRDANVVRVLHPDGTMGVYAHLNWDSIRVKPGQVVRRGEYIADSGNTGFSSGPHLHFAVQRNVGLKLHSVPVQFTGPGGTVVTPQAGTMLTAY